MWHVRGEGGNRRRKGCRSLGLMGLCKNFWCSFWVDGRQWRVLSRRVEWTQLHFKKTVMAILLKIPFPDTLPPWLLRQHSDWVPSLTDCSFSRSWLVHLLLDLLTLDSLRAQFLILFSSLSTFPYLISLVLALSKSLYRPMILNIYL